MLMFTNMTNFEFHFYSILKMWADNGVLRRSDRIWLWLFRENRTLKPMMITAKIGVLS